MSSLFESLIEDRRQEVKRYKRERNLSICKSLGFAAAFTAGIIWHSQATEAIEHAEDIQLLNMVADESVLNVWIGVSAPLGLLQAINAGIAQNGLRHTRRGENSLNELVEQYLAASELPHPDTVQGEIIASEIQDTQN